MKVGEVAARAGVNVETLRYYERRGLLPQPYRAPSGHRRYDEETVRFLPAIKEAQAVGFTLSEIADVLQAVRRCGAPGHPRRLCGCAWRRRSTRSTAGSRGSAACARSWRASSGVPATPSTTAPAMPRTSRAAAARRRRRRRSSTSRTARAPATRSTDGARRGGAPVAGRPPHRAGTCRATA